MRREWSQQERGEADGSASRLPHPAPLTGDVRIRLSDANQTAGAIVRLIQRGGRSVGGTASGKYTCTDASVGAETAAVPLNDYGRRLMRRQGSLRVTLRFRLTNGSGVTNTIQRAAVIRRER